MPREERETSNGHFKERKMSNLTRYGLFDDVFNDFAKGFFLKPMVMEDAPELQIRIDVKEDKNAYRVHADIPGTRKEDIQVTVDGNVVTIRAEMKRSAEQKDGEKLLRTERFVGTVSRSFQLPYEIDLASAEAKYQDGVLDLQLPKRAAVSAKQLTIQ
jgi:HSP20 family protein